MQGKGEGVVESLLYRKAVLRVCCLREVEIALTMPCPIYVEVKGSFSVRLPA